MRGRLGRSSAAVITAVFSLCSFAPHAHSEVIGPVYAISEPDMLQEIKARLLAEQRSGHLAQLQKEAVARSEYHMRHPAAVEGLSRTLVRREYFWDPTVTVTHDLITQDGTVIARAGQHVNPLDQVALAERLIFIDGRDRDSLARVRALLTEASRAHRAVMVILTGGSFEEIEQALQVPVYFDQGGYLVHKLGIAHVPAQVEQEGSKLRIEEVPL